ncbi:MAG: phosphatase [Candidatus Saganbacteria bacterium]|nr:phosphatase [Candidatus Saganbacteria bacterium]
MKLAADLHVHTISSGHAYSTLEEYVEQAKKIGLEMIAITDHGPAMPGAPHYYHFSNMRMIPREIDGIRVLRGCEANIINKDGELDLPKEETKIMDILMAAMHIRCGYDSPDEEQNTEAYLKAIKKYPRINVIAHPGSPTHPVNLERIVEIAKANRVVIEINSSSFVSRPGSWDRCLKIAKEVKRQDWVATIGSDAHISPMLAEFRQAIKLVKEAGLSEKYIVNTSIEKIGRYILKRRG